MYKYQDHLRAFGRRVSWRNGEKLSDWDLLGYAHRRAPKAGMAPLFRNGGQGGHNFQDFGGWRGKALDEGEDPLN